MFILIGGVALLAVVALIAARNRVASPVPPAVEPPLDEGSLLPPDTTPAPPNDDNPGTAPPPPEVIGPPVSDPAPTPDPQPPPPNPGRPQPRFDVGETVYHINLKKNGVVKSREWRVTTWLYGVDFGIGPMGITENYLGSENKALPAPAPPPEPRPVEPPKDPGVTIPTAKYSVGDVLEWRIGPVRSEVRVVAREFGRSPYPTEWSYSVVRQSGVPFWTREGTLYVV